MRTFCFTLFPMRFWEPRLSEISAAIFPTVIRSDYRMPEQEYGEVLYANHDYQGQTVEVGRDILISVSADNYLTLRVGRKTYRSQCRFLTSDDWARFSTGTTGDAWPTRITSADLLLTKEDGRIVLRRNGMIEIAEEAAKEAGMQGHIAKPIDINALKQTLREVLFSERESAPDETTNKENTTESL